MNYTYSNINSLNLVYITIFKRFQFISTTLYNYVLQYLSYTIIYINSTFIRTLFYIDNNSTKFIESTHLIKAPIINREFIRLQFEICSYTIFHYTFNSNTIKTTYSIRTTNKRSINITSAKIQHIQPKLQL